MILFRLVADEVSATPITLPGQEVPVGGDEVSATPITLPGQEVPVGGDEVSGLPIPIPGGELPTGGEDLSVLPIPVPEPPASGGVDPAPERSVDDEIALDRKGGDAPVGIGVEEVPPTDVELAVEAVEEVHVEEVRFEEVEVDTVESIEPAFEPEILSSRRGGHRRSRRLASRLMSEVRVTVRSSRGTFASILTVPASPVEVAAVVPALRALDDSLIAEAVTAVENEGGRISCRLGCAACCYQLVPVTEMEAQFLTKAVDTLPPDQRHAVRARATEAVRTLEAAGLLA